MMHSIFRIPACMITPESQSKYKPQVVSLGPYHYGEEHLKPMEEAKNRALVHLLGQLERQDQINNIQDLIILLKQNVKDLMNAYVDLNEEWQKQEEFFLKMMILDASFIIAIFRANCLGYCSDRTIFRKHEKLTIIPLIKKDMLLLENQLPFSAIWKLMDVFKVDKKTVLQQFFFPGVSLEVQFLEKDLHLLDILRRSMIPGLGRDHLVCMHRSVHDPVATIITSHSATRLNNSRIEFTRSESESLLDVKFHKSIVHLPALFMDQNSELLFLNLVAFEILYFKVHRMSSFLLVMGGLLLMPDDVRLLRDSNIIHSHAISDTALIEIIKSVIRGLSFTGDDEFCRLQQQLNDGYMTNKKLWSRKIIKWFSILNDSPWTAIVGVVATMIGLTATVVGAYYTYKSYHLTNLTFNVLQKFNGRFGYAIVAQD